MWYLCGLGSNIEPEKNIGKAVLQLLERHGSLWLSPVVHTRPSGIDTNRCFLNALSVLFSPLSPVDFKRQLNQLEESLGRDRSDPLRSYKDRTIDIDILEYSRTGSFTGVDIDEPYYRDLFEGRDEELVRAVVEVAGHTLGKTSASIHGNLGAGDEVIVYQGQQLQDHTVKATLPGQ